MMKKKVIVGISGGVDSAVTAYLLKNEGYEVIGMTMQTLDSTDECYDPTMFDDARKVAESLGIELNILNYSEQFKSKIINSFVEDYVNGRTPNPCVMCNRLIKWEALYEMAEKIGADFVATGHYAEICKHNYTGRYTLKMSLKARKDQTYMLYNLTQEQLKSTLMPLYKYSKDEVREIAKKAGLFLAEKPDSQEICFIKNNKYSEYITEFLGASLPTGNFVDIDDKILGQHKSIINYTIGQRKGLGIALGQPMFVVKIRPETNEVVLDYSDRPKEESQLYTNTLYAGDVNFVGLNVTEPVSNESFRAKAKIRYAQTAAPCTFWYTENHLLKCVFDDPQRAITPGQSLVIYDENDYLLCGGIIQ